MSEEIEMPIVTAKSDHALVNTDLSSRRTGMSFQRTRMSADRTLMSTIRTALSLIGFGFTISNSSRACSRRKSWRAACHRVISARRWSGSASRC